jgi:PAS domain S-box-containing protein
MQDEIKQLQEEVAELKKELAYYKSKADQIKMILNSLPDYVCIHDSEKVLFINDAIIRDSEYKRDEIEGSNILDFIFGNEKNVVKEKMRRRFLGENVPEYEIRLQSKEGIEITAAVNGLRIDYEGKPAIVTVLTNITERKKSEQQLIENEKLFRLLAEHSQDMVFKYSLEPEPHFEYVSPSVTKLIGYTPQEHYDDPELGLKCIHENDRCMLEQMSKPDFDFSKPLMLRWYRKDGSILWTEQRMTPVYKKQKLVAIYGTSRDVTEKVRLETALRESEERFSAAFEASLDACYICRATFDDDGILYDFTFTNINSEGEKQMGSTKAEMIGKKMCELFPINKTHGFFEKYKKVYETGIPLDNEYFIPGDYPGAGWYRHQIIKTSDGIHINNKNITDLKIAEFQIQEQENNLRTLISASGDLILVYDEEIRCLNFYGDLENGKARALIGKSPEQIFGKKTGSEVRSSLMTVKATCQSETLYSEIIIHGQKRSFFNQFYPIQLHQGKFYIGQIAHNITTFHESLDELKDIKHKLLDLEGKLSQYGLTAELSPPKTQDNNEDYILIEDEKPQFVAIRDIRCISSQKNYTSVCLSKEKFTIRRTMKEWESLLPSNIFIRLNRSEIINVLFIERIDDWFRNKYSIKLKGLNEKFLVSKSKLKQFTTVLSTHNKYPSK